MSTLQRCALDGRGGFALVDAYSLPIQVVLGFFDGLSYMQARTQAETPKP